LAELYLRYKGLVFGVCFKYLTNKDAAEDAVMDIYQELINKCLKYEIDNFAPWLHRLACNHCLMILRKQKTKNIVNVDDQFMQNNTNLHLDDDMDTLLEKENQLNSLQNCLSQLEEAQKQSVTLFYLQQKCYNEIAAITGLEWSKVRSYIQNGRRNIKICMEKKHETTA
jgi:RNA polymerase sigma factor (sigma-70 family)